MLSFPDLSNSCALQIGLDAPSYKAPDSIQYKPNAQDLLAQAKAILAKCPSGGKKSVQKDDLGLLNANLGWYVEVTYNIEEKIVALTDAVGDKLNEVCQPVLLRFNHSWDGSN